MTDVAVVRTPFLSAAELVASKRKEKEVERQGDLTERELAGPWLPQLSRF